MINNIISEFNGFLHALGTINRNPFFKPHWDWKFTQKKLLNIVFKYVVITAVHFMLNFYFFSSFPRNIALGYALQTTYLQQQNLIFLLCLKFVSDGNYFLKKDILLGFVRITPLSSHQVLIGLIAGHLLYVMLTILLFMLFTMLVFLGNADKVELTYVLTTIVNFNLTIFLFLAIFVISDFLVEGELVILIKIVLSLTLILVNTLIVVAMLAMFMPFWPFQEENFFMENEYMQVLAITTSVFTQFVPTSAKLACSAKNFISEENSCVYKIQNENIDVYISPRIFEKIDPYLHAKSKELISTLEQNYEIINRVYINLNQLKQAIETGINVGKLRNSYMTHREGKFLEIYTRIDVWKLPIIKNEWFFSSSAVIDNIAPLLKEVPKLEYFKDKSLLDDDLIVEILDDINKLKDEREKIEASQRELMILLLDNKLPISLDFDYYTSNSLMLGMIIIIKILILIVLYIWGVKNIFR